MMCKKWFATAACLTFAVSVQAGHKDEILQIQFRQMAEECQLAVDGEPGYDLPAGANSVANCYADKVNQSFRQARSHRGLVGTFYGDYLTVPRFSYLRDRSAMLQAAIGAEPRLALTAYQAALKGRLNPYHAHRVASASLPARASDLTRVTVAMGADPNRLLEATAAGRRED